MHASLPSNQADLKTKQLVAIAKRRRQKENDLKQQKIRHMNKAERSHLSATLPGCTCLTNTPWPPTPSGLRPTTLNPRPPDNGFCRLMSSVLRPCFKEPRDQINTDENAPSILTSGI